MTVDISAAVLFLLGLSEEPMKDWELRRAIPVSLTEFYAVLDEMEADGQLVVDRYGYYSLVSP